MKPKSDILFRSKISERKYREIIRYFSIDLTAEQTAKLTHLNRKTVNRYYGLLREKIADYCESVSMFKGEVELDESYFGGRKKGDKRGRGVTNKIPVFGIKRRDGKVYTQIIKNASKAQIKPIIKRLVEKESTVYTDGWGAYDGLVFNGYKHYRINHSEEFADKKNHINGIENFWGWAKLRLAKFRGLSRKSFYLHLKESEFRFNFRKNDLYDILIKIIGKNKT